MQLRLSERKQAKIPNTIIKTIEINECIGNALLREMKEELDLVNIHKTSPGCLISLKNQG